MRKRGGAEVFRITGARQGLAEDVRRRQRRYAISMSIRTASVILGVALWNVERYVAIVALVLGTVLPYIAVVIANGGRENATSLPSILVPVPAPPTLPGPAAEPGAESPGGASPEDGGGAGGSAPGPTA
ncbi:DUF3099 domain-containing protein [Streptomyces sp. JNUCC 64]